MRIFRNKGIDDPALIERVANENGISGLVAAALCLRGVTKQAAVRAFLEPGLDQLHDPLLLPGIGDAVTRITAAIDRGENILIYGDYDVDGVSATAILYQYLEQRGARVGFHIPLRHGEGYGMHPDAVRRAKDADVALIITVDNGISAVTEIKLAYELGMEVVVTDHHQCPDALPVCAAVVNPHLPGSVYPACEICGAVVALKLVEAMGGREAMLPYLSLAALATVADVMPLLGENRAIVALGIQAVRQHAGLMALLEAAGAGEEPVTSDTLAFRLAPRLNAAGRMGDASRALNLLLSKSRAEALPIALTLDRENASRQQEERKILKDAKKQMLAYNLAANRGILLYGEDWNKGVIGIVASRLVEEYHRPVLLFHKEGDTLTGSGRSIPGVHLFECLKSCSAHCVRYGGHAQAAGLTVELAQYEAFFQAFQRHLLENIDPAYFLPTMEYEIETPLHALTMPVVEELKRLSPFGQGNPQPVFATKGVELQNLERMGKDQTHLRATAVEGERRAALVAFGEGAKAESWAKRGLLPKRFTILYTPDINVFRGNKRLQLMLKAANETTFWREPAYIWEQTEKFYDAFFTNVLYNVKREFVGVSTATDMDATVIEALTKNAGGTLIACLTPQGAESIKVLLSKSGLWERTEAGFDWEEPVSCVNHRLMLAPSAKTLPILAKGYVRLILYDCGTDSPLSQALIGASPIPVTTREGSSPAEGAFLRLLATDRPHMERCFRAFYKALGAGGCNRGRLMFEALPCEPYEEALLSLLVFAQLGFFHYDPNLDEFTTVESPAQRSLSESTVYAAALAAQ